MNATTTLIDAMRTAVAPHGPEAAAILNDVLAAFEKSGSVIDLDGVRDVLERQMEDAGWIAADALGALEVPVMAPARCVIEFCCYEATREVSLVNRGEAGRAPILWGYCAFCWAKYRAPYVSAK